VFWHLRIMPFGRNLLAVRRKTEGDEQAESTN